MDRRTFLGSAAGAVASRQLSAQSTRPNVLLILADDLGYGDLGCYGQRDVETPNLDLLAAQGVRFTQGYSGSTVCAPSRCSLMTGKHSGHATIRGNGPERGPEPSEAMIPELFRKAGYRTALFGKWGLGGPLSGSAPWDRGFDRFFGYLSQTHAHNYYPESIWEDRQPIELRDNWFNQRKQWIPELMTRRAEQWLGDAQANQPFFAFFSSIIPHANNERGALTRNGQDVPHDGKYASKSWPLVEKNFAAGVSYLDEQVGRLIKVLERSGQLDNTLILFSSDNGPHQEGGHHPLFFRSSGPLRGIKRDLYEGGIRVPFLAKWPGVTRPGQVSREVVAFWDLLPTFADLLGQAKPKDVDGISLLPTLKGTGPLAERTLYWEFHEGGFANAVRRGKWKAVRTGVGRPLELYDLEQDLGETRNVAGDHPEVVQEMERELKAARTESKLFPVRGS